MNAPKHMAVREWGGVAADEHGLAPSAVDRLLASARHAATRLKLGNDAVLTPTDVGFKAGQVVGVLSVPGVTVEILPKVDGPDGAVRAALVRMLAVARKLKVAHGDLAAMDTQRHDLLELLIQLFSRRLLAAVRRGLPRRYLRREEDLAVPRGTLDVKRQFTALAVRPYIVASRFEELSEDTPLNRVCRAAVTRLAGVTRVPANHRRLMELLARLDSVADSASPLDEPVALDRTNAAFHDVHRLARLFLQGDWQDATGGRESGFALLFPMNILFEEFVGRALQTALGSDRVRLQSERRFLGPTKDPPAVAAPLAAGRRYIIRPDIVVDLPSSKPVGRRKGLFKGPAILDTKWKRLGPDGPDRADVYQMLAYGQAYRAHRVVLVYPWHEGVGPEGVLWRRSVTGADFDFEVATVDVGRPDEVQGRLRAQFDVQAADGHSETGGLRPMAKVAAS